MRCKVGDLAVITSGGRYPENIDRLVEVISLWRGERVCGVLYASGDWVVRGIGGDLRYLNGWARDSVARDCVLRPIRDPGDDARDETLEWLPVPSREEVVA
jgi:hypothetical protein